MYIIVVLVCFRGFLEYVSRVIGKENGGMPSSFADRLFLSSTTNNTFPRIRNPIQNVNLGQVCL